MKKFFLIFELLMLFNMISCTYNYYYYDEEEQQQATDLKKMYPDLPTTSDTDIVNGMKPVTIAANNEIVAKVLVPTESYDLCEVEWSTIPGLTCEGQYISSDKYAISTYIDNKWQYNKHRNWESSSKDKGGQNISGSGEGGSCTYNFRYSI